MLTELDEMKRDFLEVLAITGDAGEASGDADDLRELELARAADAEFAGLWNRALAVWADDVAAGLPVPTMGDPTTMSTPLLAFVLRLRRPEKHASHYDDAIRHVAAVVESN